MANAQTQFGGFLTNVGVVKQTNANALQIPWKITRMQLGDAGGEPALFPDPTPSPTQTDLINVVYDAPLNALYPSPTDPGVLIAELVLPPDVGGWWIRETALRDEDGDLIAVAAPAPSYKPLIAQGSGRTQTIRMHVVVGNTANIQLRIDPSIVLATRAQVEAGDAEARAYAKQLAAQGKDYAENLVAQAATEATQAEAEAGEDGTRKMTPRRVFQALRSDLGRAAIHNAAWPVGAYYTQFSEADGSFSSAKSPATLFGGTWTLRFNDESVFFRTEGALAADGRVGGLQQDAFQGHWHDQWYSSVLGRPVVEGTAKVIGIDNPNDTLAGANNSIRDPQSDGVNGGPRTAAETRPRNRLIRVWERTA